MRLLLEGPAIEPLLARVRAEHGSSARIVGAERVRSGGVGGFFSKEHYEVTVEVDDAQDGGEPGSGHDEPEALARPVFDGGGSNGTEPADTPRGIDALVAAAEQAERDEQPGDDRPGHDQPSHDQPSHDQPGHDQPSHDQPSHDESSRHDHTAQEQPDPERDVLGPHRPLSTESAAFAKVLQALQEASAPPAAVTDTGDAEPTAPTTPGSAATPAAWTPSSIPPEPAPAASPPPASTPKSTKQTTAFVPRTLSPEEIPHRVRKESADMTPEEPTHTPQSTGGFHSRVAATGLPAELLAALPEDCGPAELLAVLRGLPKPPALPKRGPQVIAVVGERGEATRTARRLANRLGLDADADAVATPSSTDEAALVAAQARAHRSVVVAVVEASFDPREGSETVELLLALHPQCTVACVDATRKDGDTRAWLDGWSEQGILVAGMSVSAADITADPATVLGQDVPVLEVNGVPASAATWFALLMDRIDMDRIDR